MSPWLRRRLMWQDRALRDRAKGADELRALRASLAAKSAASPLQKDEPLDLPPPGFIAPGTPKPLRPFASFV